MESSSVSNFFDENSKYQSFAICQQYYQLKKKIAVYFNFKMHKKAQSGKMKNLLSKRKKKSSNQLYTVTLMKLLPKNFGNVSWKHWL